MPRRRYKPEEIVAKLRQVEPHRHDGAELVYVLKGKLVVNIDGDDTALDEGDALYFDPKAPHSYCSEGPSPCAAIVVVTPESKA
jgi:quercetin dioxygenase-like cupin family protein